MDNRKIVELDLNDILPNRFQPRIKFNETSITELADSIQEHGVIQPIVVRPLGDRYEIIAGERRYKASVLAGKETIPAIITELNDKDSAEVALIENVQRQDLTPIEEAISYKKILDMGYLTQEELAEKLGKTQSTVANKLRLLNLDDEIQEALLETRISERHARSLLKLSNKEQQKRMLARIISERLTVRRTDEEIKKMMNENNNTNIEIMDFNENQQNNISTSLGGNSNIPTAPIVEDVISGPVAQTPIINEKQIVNPGFMNVDQIEREAQDINIPPRPIANMEQLLKPADILNSTSVPPMTTIENVIGSEDEGTSAEAMLKPGKFFNLADLEEEPKTEVNNVNIPVMSADPINDILNTANVDLQILPVEETKEASGPIEPIAEPVINSNFVTNFGNNNILEKPTPIIPVNPEPLVQTPIMEPMSNQTISVPNNNDLDMGLGAIPSGPAIPSPVVSEVDKMKQAMNLIRECVSKIQALGLAIETEEYDFEDMYQTIFKINK